MIDTALTPARRQESYTIAHHVFTEAGSCKIMIGSLRYMDAFAKIKERWYFAERKLLERSHHDMTLMRLP